MDADGDGFTTLEEYFAGTNPHNSSSAIRIINAEQVGSKVRTSLGTVLGKKFRLECSDNFPSAVWHVVANNLVGINGILDVMDPGGANQPQRYYRLQVLP
jgi:hypothetical protein